MALLPTASATAIATAPLLTTKKASPATIAANRSPGRKVVVGSRYP
jgi:hypothetical protein